VDDILLANSDVSQLLETKRFLSSNFDMKDLSEASLVCMHLKKFSMHASKEI
jgi:hypothetical protein